MAHSAGDGIDGCFGGIVGSSGRSLEDRNTAESQYAEYGEKEGNRGEEEGKAGGPKGSAHVQPPINGEEKLTSRIQTPESP
jgi:hypothetical protein